MPLLHLFLQLRSASYQNAGYLKQVIINNLTNHKRFVLIPKMRELGWIIGDKLVSVNKIVNMNSENESSNNIIVKLDFEYLKSKTKLNQFILAATELYILKGKYKSEKKGILQYDRDLKCSKRKQIKRVKLYQTEQLKFSEEIIDNQHLKKDSVSYRALIARSMLSTWGFSEKEVSKLRKGKINQYKQQKVVSHPSLEPNCYYSPKKGIFFRKIPTEVTSNKGLELYYYNRSCSSFVKNINCGEAY